MPIILQESLRAVFYAPYYAALARNAYADEGLEVRFVSAPAPGKAATALLDGTADVCWGGPMRVMDTYEHHPGCDLVCFGEAVTRDPFFLIGRTPRPQFRLPDLRNLRLATVSEVPTPWMCLQEDLRRVGTDPASLDRVTDRTMADNAAALRAGTLDVAQLFQPLAEELLENGCHLLYAQAARGPTSYTTFYARRPLLQTRRDELRRLVRGLYRTQIWLAGADEAAIADAIARWFPDIPPDRLRAACGRYRSLGVWGRSPVLAREGYERLRASLVSGQFVRTGVPYEQAVDNSLAEEVVAGG